MFVVMIGLEKIEQSNGKWINNQIFYLVKIQSEDSKLALLLTIKIIVKLLLRVRSNASWFL